MKHDFQRSSGGAVDGALHFPVLLPQVAQPSPKYGWCPNKRQPSFEANIRFQERCQERERIARELHDTLFQGFLAASLQLGTAVDEMPSDSPAKPSLNRVLNLIGHVIDEGRMVLHGLRVPSMPSGSLEQALSDMIREVAPTRARIQLVVTGKARLLKPEIHREICLIGREALSNALRHSDATLIEVLVEYRLRNLRLVISDNGRGMDQQAVKANRHLHWGLRGMQERANLLGGRFRIWSRRGSGTELEVRVPLGFATDAEA